MAIAARAKPKQKKNKRTGKPTSKSSGILGAEMGIGQLISQIQEGFPFAAFENLAERCGLSREIVANAIQVPLRTLARRKEEGRFHADESDRLFRIARLLDRCVELFEGDVNAARDWLTAKQMTLADSTPLDYARTEVGAREVETLIGRLEHGIPS